VTGAREVEARPKRAWPFPDDGASEPNIDSGATTTDRIAISHITSQEYSYSKPH
jgi:hypothetical protein